jgi:hypothetical protein
MPRPSHPPWFDHLNNWTIGEEYRLWSSSLSNFLHPLFTLFLLGPNIILCILFSNTLNLCSSLDVRDQVSHPNKTTDKSIFLYILIFTFYIADGKTKILNCTVAIIPHMPSLTSFLCASPLVFVITPFTHVALASGVLWWNIYADPEAGDHCQTSEPSMALYPIYHS